MISFSLPEAQHIALQLHRSGSLAEAEMLYRRILDAAPASLDALHFLAVLCHQQGKNEEAAGLIGRIIEVAPDNFDAHNNLGNVYEGMLKLDEAEECYRRALAIKPDHAPALNNLGVMLVAQKKLTDAVEVYRRAIALAPGAADFRYNLGNALVKADEIDEAIAVYREATRLNPDHEGSWRGLAHSFLLADRRQEAAEAFEEWLRVDPGNELAKYMRSALLGENVPSRAPDAYISRVFDSMARTFDNHLVEDLGYRAPNLVAGALSATLPPPASNFEILDAGCGTGLLASLLKPYAKRLIGVDLSQGMLAIAEGRRAYDDLVAAELTGYLESQTGAYDIITSADTFCYFGPLERVFSASAKALKPRGIFAFTLEDAGEKAEQWCLDPTARYAHRRSYVVDALQEAGFVIHSLSSATLRTEGGQPVTGHVVVARKSNGESAKQNPGLSKKMSGTPGA
jgi:predicted TPR repeat methyltransferase